MLHQTPFLSILFQAKPVEKREALHDPFALEVKKFISENDFKEFYELTKQMQSVLTETKKDLFGHGDGHEIYLRK